MLFIVLGIGVVALVALIVAITSGTLLMGWLTVGASAVGLALLIVDELREQEPGGVEQDAGPALPPRAALVESVDNDRNFAPEPEPAHNGEVLHPDIWPPEHPVAEIPSGDDRVEPRHARQGEVPRPDIWP